MKRYSTIAALLYAVPLFAAQITAQQEQQNPFRTFDQPAFEKHLQSMGADEATISSFHKNCKEESVGIAADLALKQLSEKYRLASNLAEDGDPKAALSLVNLLTETKDPMLRAFTRYHLGRHFLDADDPERAAEVFANYLRQDKNKTPLDAEVAFFYGTALADIPLPEDAAKTFGDFLSLFPNAPERHRAVAAQRKAELESQAENALHGIADSMKHVERKIKKVKTGKPVQTTQEEIIQKLQEIIEKMEEKEKQGSGPPSGNQQSQAPASSSQAPPGESRVGNLQKVPGVGDRWGEYKDRERKAIESEVANKLPGHFKKTLEGYYKKSGKGKSR